MKSQTEHYHDLLQERKDNPCTPKEQAGQFWDEKKQCDSRLIKSCPDCSPEGGDDPRCPKHEIEYLQMEIANNENRIRKIEREQNELPNSRSG